MPETTVTAWPIRTIPLTILDQSIDLSILRLHAPSRNTIQLLGVAFDCAWPVEANTAVGDDVCILWVAPTAWAIVGLGAVEVELRVARACRNTLYHLADLAPAYALFDISGVHARGIFEKSCPLDLHPRTMPPGRCAQTAFAQVKALVQSRRSGFRVYIDSSLKAYMRHWLSDAAQEYLT
jgi:sarcosine oxidase, subunit gamma